MKQVKNKIIKKSNVKKLLTKINRSNIDGLRDFAIINLIARTGLKVNELLCLKKCDIISCCGLVGLWIKQKNKSLKISNKAYFPIYKYLGSINSKNDTDPIFQSHSKKNFGQSLTNRSIYRIIKNRLKRIGIDKQFVNSESIRKSNYR